MPQPERARLLALAAALPAATLYEAAGQAGDMSPDIRPMALARPFAGIARTLRVFPGDNLGVFHAIAAAEPGEVLVIDAGDTNRVTVWGGTSTIAARAKGLVGCVTNAAVRDLAEIDAEGFAVYATGSSVRGAAKRHAGWHQEPVSVGGVVVRPGDLVVGDFDGIVVVAAERIGEVIEQATRLHEAHRARDERLKQGEGVLDVLGLPALKKGA